MWAIATNALTSWQKASRCPEAIARRAGLEIFRQPPSPDGKARYQPATTD
ncbi:putative dNA methylase [Escherichia coli P0304816.2]|nr:putative dNA methylase [Escherichia coli P0304816.2]